jgi:hypothetical protein
VRSEASGGLSRGTLRVLDHQNRELPAFIHELQSELSLERGEN